ncbi:MAG: hypothetical protein EOP09_18220, partial [Proteobacteria bacterium]
GQDSLTRFDAPKRKKNKPGRNNKGRDRDAVVTAPSEGGSQTSTFRFSYSNLMNTSIMPNNSLTRNSFTLRATQKLGKIIDLAR